MLGCSSVRGFETVGVEFVAFIKERGVNVTKADQVFSPNIRATLQRRPSMAV